MPVRFQGKRRETRDVAPLCLRATVAASTLNEEQRTVEVVWTTGERVLRGFFDRFWEELSLKPKHVRMGRLKSGAPLLNAHNDFDLRGVIGVVESAKLEKDQGVATVRFARAEDDPEADAVFRKVKDGIIRNVSVGYRIHRLEKVEEGDDKVPVYRATDWEPYEISMVPMGADAGAGVRSSDAATNPCEFVLQEERSSMPKMKRNSGTGTPSAAPAATPGGEGDGVEDQNEDAGEDAGDGEEDETDGGQGGAGQPAEKPAEGGDARGAVLLERRRLKQIRNAGRVLGIDEAFVERHLDLGTPVGEFRRLAIKEIEKRKPDVDVHVESVRGGDARDKFRRCAADWLLMRTGKSVAVIAAAKKRGETVKMDAGEVRGMTLLRLAEDCLQRAGIKTRGMDPLRLAELAFDTRAGGYQTTSDFPVILDEVVNRTLLAEYELADDTWRLLAKVGSVGNFLPSKRVRLGSMGALDRVPEHAEFRNKALPDGSTEEVQIETFGNIVAVTRQVVINDDLGAIMRMIGELGRMAGITIEEEFWALLALNGGLGPVMSDGLTLFHADHGNIQPTGTALGVPGLDANRILMASQTNPSGRRIVMRPHTLLVSTAQGMLAKNLNVSEFDIDEADGVTPNGIRGMFEQIIDSPEVASTRRYIFADPQRNPTFEVNFLNGQQTPFTESRDGWRIDGKEYKVRHDFGVNAVDWRTAITDDGTP